jgi:hypothetical protein
MSVGKKLALQKAHLQVRSRSAQPEGGQHLGLLGVEGAHPRDRLGIVDRDGVPLNPPQLRQHRVWRRRVTCLAQPGTHHAIQDQRQKADARVAADALGQPMQHRGDLDLGLQDLEAALDVGQALVAHHDLGGRQVLDVGHQQQLAVHGPRTRQGHRVDVVGEQLGLEVHADDARQVGVCDLVEEPRLGAAVGELATAVYGAGILAVELARQVRGARLQFGDVRIALRRLLAGAHGRVR